MHGREDPFYDTQRRLYFMGRSIYLKRCRGFGFPVKKIDYHPH